MFPIEMRNPRYSSGKVKKGANLYGLPLNTVSPTVMVPCRKCPSCLHKRAMQWVFKIMQHDKKAITAYFVTFTYSNMAIKARPLERLSENGFLTLNLRDVQLFFKRLRKNDPGNKGLKYYLCGEYGSKRKRPHYHAIIFNSTPASIESAWIDTEGKGKARKSTPIGDVRIDDVNWKTVVYTAKYMFKGPVVPAFKGDDRKPEFQVFSRGLGKSYISPANIAWHQADISRNYVVMDGGIKLAMPDYFRKRIFSEEQRELQAIFAQERAMRNEQIARQKFINEYGKDDMQEYHRIKIQQKWAAIAAHKKKQTQRADL